MEGVPRGSGSVGQGAISPDPAPTPRGRGTTPELAPLPTRSRAMKIFRHLFTACTAGAILTFVVVEWLRHRSYVKHRDSGFIPSTQHIVFAGLFVAGAFELAAVVFLVLYVASRL